MSASQKKNQDRTSTQTKLWFFTSKKEKKVQRDKFVGREKVRVIFCSENNRA